MRLTTRAIWDFGLPEYTVFNVQIWYNGTSDDGKVTDKPQGVAAPAFEDEGDESKLESGVAMVGHANEVPNVPLNQGVSYRDREMHESEVNENGKRMQETTTLGSTFSDKKTSPSISEGEEAGGDDAVNQDDGRSGDRPSGKIPRDESPEFIKKLEKIFLQFGDYILAMILKNLKLRLDQENLAEAYRRKIGVLTKENGGDSAEAGKIVERQIRDVFGEDFQLTLDRYLESFVERINLP
ncbi:uncharacterized protein LOC135170367 isoform X3 [Diachasmimorpha longicaudata]|uniref:uncharacterized protein LOC135170367 isoform X3 n=1 Tax=Diachasmimorpha longicaudata TaxID=58733 RepID=UPI0030B8D8B2